MYRVLWLGLAGVLCGGLAARPAAALFVYGYSSATNNRFGVGYLPNTAPTFIGAGYDWSGVGWLTADPNRSFALIDPRHILIANHYAPGVGSSITFASADGQLHTYTVEQQLGTHAGYPPDMAVAVLSTPIAASDNVHSYPILFKGYSKFEYIGDQLLLYGFTAKIGTNWISDAGQLLLTHPEVGPDSAQYFSYGYSPTAGRAALQYGDSGSPSFTVSGGQMYLSGGHYLGYGYNGTYFAGGGLDTMLSTSLDVVSGYTAQTGYLPYVVTPVSSTWAGTVDANWQTTGNWSTSTVPGDVLNGGGKVTTCASLAFNGATTAQRTINLGSDRTVTGMTFNQATGTNGFTFSSGNTLTVGEAGIRNLDDDAQTFNCDIKLRSSQRWDIGSGGLNVTGAISPDNNGSYLLLVEGAGNATFSGAISDSVSGSMGLSKDGLGTLTLSSPSGNTYSGKTFVNGGTLLFNSAAAIGGTAGRDVTVNAGGAVALNVADLTTNLFPRLVQSSAGTVALTSLNSAENLDFNTAGFTAASLGAVGAVSYTGTLTPNGTTYRLGGGGGTLTMSNTNALTGGNSLVVNGSGIVILSAANDYTGVTTVSAGILQAASPAALYNDTGNMAKWTKDKITVNVGGTLAVNYGGGGTDFTQSQVATLLANLSTSLNNNGLKAGSAFGFNTANASSGVSYGNAISDSTGTGGGAVGLVKLGAGTLTLGAANAYTGPTTITAGTLALAHVNALQNSTLNTGPSGAQQVTFTVAGSNTYNLGGLQGADALAIGANTISVGANGASTSYSGIISGIDGGLTKVGGGSLTLSAANTYSGLTTVNGGTVRLAHADALGSTAAGTVVVVGELDLNGLTLGGEALTLNGPGIGGNGALTNGSTSAASLSGAVALGSGVAIGGAGDITLNGTFDYGTSALTKTGGKKLTLTGSQTWGNGATVTVSSGTLRYELGGSQTVAVGTGNSVTIANTATLELAGSKAALSDGTRHVNVVNNSTNTSGLVIGGTNQWVGGIGGSGSTIVQNDASLTADYIVQDTLTIGSGGSVTIRSTVSGLVAGSTYSTPASDAGVTNLAGTGDAATATSGTSLESIVSSAATTGSPSGTEGFVQPGGGSASVSIVPEPGLYVLLATGAAGLGWRLRRQRRLQRLRP